MKIAFFLSVLFTAASVFAQTCPNLEGNYSSSMGTSLRFVQQDCKSLIRMTAPRYGNMGNMGYAVKRQYVLGGAPVCITAELCETATVENENTIKFSFNAEAHVMTASHGFCVSRETLVTKEANGNLTYQMNVSGCDDGFQGSYSEQAFLKKD